MPRPKDQRTRLTNRPPPSSDELAEVGLARITILRVGAEDARTAQIRVMRAYSWGKRVDRKPYAVGHLYWVFVFRPLPAAATPQLEATAP